MMAIDPTGTPWQTGHDFDLEGRTTIIGNVDGEIIEGRTHHTYDFVCRTIDEANDSQSPDIAVANADLIVRAVNSHRALIVALEDIMLCALSSDVSKIAIAEKARAAIAKARGTA